jgi:hypothetical protein
MTNLVRRTTTVLLALSVVILAAGCGSGGSNTSKAAFVKRADAICKAGDDKLRAINTKIGAVQRGSDEAKIFTQLASLTAQSVTISGTYVDQLDALETPSGDRDKLKAWIAGARRQIKLVSSLSRALAAHDQAKIATVSEQIATLAQKNNAFAGSYGMAECAKSQ